MRNLRVHAGDLDPEIAPERKKEAADPKITHSVGRMLGAEVGFMLAIFEAKICNIFKLHFEALLEGFWLCFSTQLGPQNRPKYLLNFKSPIATKYCK